RSARRKHPARLEGTNVPSALVPHADDDTAMREAAEISTPESNALRLPSLLLSWLPACEMLRSHTRTIPYGFAIVSRRQDQGPDRQGIPRHIRARSPSRLA